MSFAPVLPVGGYGGWTFLKRTADAQQAAFARNPALVRDEAYFRDRIASATTAEALVADRRLLAVALGAFGLDADLGNRFFIRKVLEDGTTADRALASRLADKQYRAFSAAFGFGDPGTPGPQRPGFADTILKDYRNRRFENAVGEGNGDMRLALNAERELARLAATDSTERTKWFAILGSPPLRAVFLQAFGLSPVMASLGIDQQVTALQTRAKSLLGDASVTQFRQPDRIEGLLRNFFVRSDAATAIDPATRGYGALQMLRPGFGTASPGILSLLG